MFMTFFKKHLSTHISKLLCHRFILLWYISKINEAIVKVKYMGYPKRVKPIIGCN